MTRNQDNLRKVQHCVRVHAVFDQEHINKDNNGYQETDSATPVGILRSILFLPEWSCKMQYQFWFAS